MLMGLQIEMSVSPLQAMHLHLEEPFHGVAKSMMESEYVACTAAMQEAIWLRRFLQSLNIIGHLHEVVVIYCDNTAAIAYAKDPKYHGRQST